MKKQIKDVVLRMDLYPRIDVDNKKIQEYSEHTELLPPIIINQDNILIDGLHRLRANKQAGNTEIDVVVEKTVSENEIFLRAIETNAMHGLQLSMKDKQSVAVKLYDLKNRDRLIKSLSVSPRAFDGWVSNKAKQLKAQKEDEAIALYLHAELTQQQVAAKIGVDNATITRILQNCKNAELQKPLNFQPFLYNIWNVAKEDNAIKHFGLFPEIFFENLLYYYTEPFDIVFDPFVGGGTTIDMCKKWFRRYYVSDLNPIPAREEEIKKFDICSGLPGDLPAPKFVFLDPPYWKQAEGKYSNDDKDLSNMALDKFYESIETIAKNLKKKMKEGYVAFVIQPTQWSNDKKFEDHIIKVINIFTKVGFKEEMRYVLPYSSQQCTPQMVNIAKEQKFPLNLVRDLVVFKI